MTLLSEIKETAADPGMSLTVILGKCRDLAFRIPNEALGAWVNCELEGYGSEIGVPGYRVFTAYAYGDFVGPGNVTKSDEPIPSRVLDPEDRRWAERLELREPISVYADLLNRRGKEDSGLLVPWNPNLINKYQEHFFEGHYILRSAGQRVGRSQLVGILDTIRNKIVGLAHELEKTPPEIGESSKPASPLTQQTVSRLVDSHIYGPESAPAPLSAVRGRPSERFR